MLRDVAIAPKHWKWRADVTHSQVGNVLHVCKWGGKVRKSYAVNSLPDERTILNNQVQLDTETVNFLPVLTENLPNVKHLK